MACAVAYTNIQPSVVYASNAVWSGDQPAQKSVLRLGRTPLPVLGPHGKPGLLRRFLIVAFHRNAAASLVASAERHSMDDALNSPGHYDSISTAVFFLDTVYARGVYRI